MNNILIVEDDDSLREIMVKILQEKFRVLEAENGVQAMDSLDSQKVDLVILDLVMPKQNGLETMLEAKFLYPHLKFILISGSEEELARAKSFGGEFHLVKPVKKSTLVSKVEEVLCI